jgi:GTP pyrophosphokinase
MYKIDKEAERKEILRRYRVLLNSMNPDSLTGEKKKKLRKAFNLAAEAHKDMRRKSGEPYIYHPLEVSTICVRELGLGPTSATCALLHDVVEDTDYTLEDIRNLFGEKEALIIDGLTKIESLLEKPQGQSIQAENFKKILLSMSEDIRVILIKLADRLHNMRTLDSLPSDKRLKIASETLSFYAPFAHRLGLYEIKSELEDLSLKYTEPEIYKFISQKIKDSGKERKLFIEEFNYAIKKSLNQLGIKHRIEARLKSVNSIWNKMKTKKIPFEEVYDLFAVRIIIDVPRELEKIECWKVYSVITKHYIPKHDRLRDWISTPKANGYESLHTTVMSDRGRWVEIQIRSERMNDIAERGYAAHWKYKNANDDESSLDKWINRINQLLRDSENNENALEFLEHFKLNLFSDEIFVFTPKGELRTLPVGATALDFAYSIHSEVGDHAMGAKVNHRVVSLTEKLKSGDQIEIITSDNQLPSDEWQEYVITPRAKNHIKKALREQHKEYQNEGRAILEKLFGEYDLELTQKNLNHIKLTQNINSDIDLFYYLATGEITVNDIKRSCTDIQKKTKYDKPLMRYLHIPFKRRHHDTGKTEKKDKKEIKPHGMVIGDVEDNRWSAATCCNPVPGDEVIGYIKNNDHVEIHRINCPTAIQLMSKFADKITTVKWSATGSVMLLTGIKIEGNDKRGLVDDIIRTISEQQNINIRAVNISAKEDLVEGEILFYVKSIQDLREVRTKLLRLKNIQKAYRVETIKDLTKHS